MLLAGAAIAALVVVLSGGEPETPEEIIRAALTDMAKAAGEGRPGGILEHVSDDFRLQGGIDKDRLRGMLLVQLRRRDWTRVVLYDTEVVLQSPELADAMTRAVLARGDGPIPSRADRWEIDLTFQKEDGSWLVREASYRSRR